MVVAPLRRTPRPAGRCAPTCTRPRRWCTPGRSHTSSPAHHRVFQLLVEIAEGVDHRPLACGSGLHPTERIHSVAKSPITEIQCCSRAHGIHVAPTDGDAFRTPASLSRNLGFTASVFRKNHTAKPSSARQCCAVDDGSGRWPAAAIQGRRRACGWPTRLLWRRFHGSVRQWSWLISIVLRAQALTLMPNAPTFQRHRAGHLPPPPPCSCSDADLATPSARPSTRR